MLSSLLLLSVSSLVTLVSAGGGGGGGAGCTEFKALWGACRTTTGGYGTYTKPTCNNCNVDKCMALCSNNPACVAFEFNSETKNCEIHTEAITHAKPSVANTKCGVCKTGECPLSNKKAHLMYQTRTTIDADFGVKESGLTPRQNADKICRQKIPEGHACAVGSKFEVRAFVSIDGNDQLKDWANYGIPGFDPSGPVYGLEETSSDKIGSSWGSLFDGYIDTTLDDADILNSGYWWSGSWWNGSARGSYTCRKNGVPWSTNSGSSYYKAQYGRRDKTSYGWLANGSSGHCDSSSKYLLCTCHCKGGPQNELTPSPTKSPVKAPTDSPTPAPTTKPTSSPVEAGSGCTEFKALWGACRTTTGGYGTYTKPTCNNCNVDKCMALCSNNPACVAFEFNSETKNCEIHTDAITHAKPSVANTKCGVCKTGGCPLSNKKAHLMYQTRTTIDADFGVKESGLTPRQNADKICRQKIPEGHACAVGSKFKVRAFVSIDGNDQLKDWANYGIPGFDPNGPVYGLEETSSDKIGSSWGSLFDGYIDTTLDDADILNSGYWWSGSWWNGAARTAYTCRKDGVSWSTNSGSDDYKAQYGRRDKTSYGWLANGSSGHCDSSSKYLLCTCHCFDEPANELTPSPTKSPVKAPTDSPTPAPTTKPTSSPVEAGSGCTEFKALWGACRTTTGGYGTYTKPTCNNCNVDKCMALCSNNPACVAFEFNSETKNCEIHTEAITHAKPSVANTKCGVCKTGECPLSNKKAHLMYQTRTTIDADFGVKESGLTPRQNADKICRQKIPEGHACAVGSKFEVRAFVSIDGNDQLKDWANYGIPGFDPNGPVYGLEETSSDKIGSSWGSLFDGYIDTTLDDADILNSGYWWSGSWWNGAARTAYTCRKDGVSWSTNSGSDDYKAQYGRRDKTSYGWLANGSSGHCDSSSKYLLCTCHCKGGPQNELTPSPTKSPVNTPTDSPTPAPSNKPTDSPTPAPTDAPTDSPTYVPTDAPTPAPSNKPTDSPTPAPTDAPTDSPTYVPTDAPTPAPSNKPTDSPTPAPTDAPTDSPTYVPTDAPTPAPSNKPTDSPTPAPTDAPTDSPTYVPTDAPTPAPTNRPTRSPFELGEGCTDFVTLWGACRTSDGTKGTYYNADCQSCTADKCMALCTSDPACVAFEFSPNGCEIHTEYIAYAQPMTDVKCGVCNTLPGVCPSGDSSAVLTYSTRKTVSASFGVAESGLSPRQNADKICRDLIPEGHGCRISGAYTVRAFVSIDENDQLSDWPTYGLQGFDPNGKVYGWSDQAGYQVGSSWSSLFDGSIDQSLSSAGILTQGYWWSGSNTDGTVVATHTCKANGIPWSTSSGSSSFLSVFGKRDTTGSDWIYNTRSGHCDSSSKRLLCACYCRGPQDSLTLPPTTSPTSTPTESPTKFPTVSPTSTPTESPTKFPTTSPTSTPTESPTKFPTTSPTSTPTESPTKFPTTSPTSTPTESPTKFPTTSPTSTPTESPTKFPTTSPTSTPTESPTKFPTTSPTSTPTESPTKFPTTSPTSTPTESPTKFPTTSPTSTPTESPTKFPTTSPTSTPTESPTKFPTTSPTSTPTESPTKFPTTSPTSTPTESPTKFPTTSPTTSPSPGDTPTPTVSPTDSPTRAPTAAPSTVCDRYEFNPFNGQDIFGDGDPHDEYGTSISAASQVLVIGAPMEDVEDSFGNPLYEDTGAAYIHRIKDNGEVRDVPSQKLVSRNFAPGDQFGRSVSISKDSKYVAIGAPKDDGAGTVQIFSRDISTINTPFTAETILYPPMSTTYGAAQSYYKFGQSVSLCVQDDRAIIVVGAPAKASPTATPNIPGLVYIYALDVNGNWQYVTQFHGPNPVNGDRFGQSVHTNCKVVVVGAPYRDGPSNEANQGEAYVYRLPTNLNNFNANNVQVIPHPNCASPRDCSDDRFGWSVSVSPNSMWIAVGAPWEEIFGGTAKTGHVHVYRFNPATLQYDFWTTVYGKSQDEPEELTTAGSRFGYSVSLDDDALAVGAIQELPIIHESGAVYMFYAADSGEWVVGDMLFRAANTDHGDMYGVSVSICGDVIGVGAPMHDLHHGQVITDTGSAMIIKRVHAPGCVPTESPTSAPSMTATP